MYDLLISDVKLVDGSGDEARRTSIATIGDSIALVGCGKVRARRHIDARGLTLTPGFIDIHAHSEFYALSGSPGDLRLGQGITSGLSGNCGIGLWPLVGDRKLLEPLCADVLGRCPSWDWTDFSSFASRLESVGLHNNMAFLQAHSPLRLAVMGADFDRAASDEEIRAMCTLLDESLSQGCLGFSTGLYYQPCVSADRRELAALLSVVARHDGIFSVHMRSEGDDILSAAEEVLSLALEAGVRLEISHLKVIGRANQDKLGPLLELIHGYRDRGLDVAFDQYPYSYGSTSLFSLLPPQALALSRQELRFALQLDDMRREYRQAMLHPVGWESIYSQEGPEAVTILHLDSRDDLDGLDLVQLGERLGSDPIDALFDVLSEEAGAAIMKDVTEDEKSLLTIMADPLMSFSTDALYSSPHTHERSHSAAIHLLSLCRSHGVMSLEECVRRMSAENARRLNITDRGLVAEGHRADLVLLDESKLDEEWNGSNPALVMTIVNGKVAYEGGRGTGEAAGRILLKKPMGCAKR